jgi:hypothetical protein
LVLLVVAALAILLAGGPVFGLSGFPLIFVELAALPTDTNADPLR